MTKLPVAEQVQVNFRMPADLRDRIKVAAERNARSMNSEIVTTLESAYPNRSAAALADEFMKLMGMAEQGPDGALSEGHHARRKFIISLFEQAQQTHQSEKHLSADEKNRLYDKRVAQIVAEIQQQKGS